jgi:carbon-monoxide dehydrogenase catalytic subunit
VAAGAACYLHVAENSARKLQVAKNGINSHATRRLADYLNINAEGRSEVELAGVISEQILGDLYAPRAQKMSLLGYLAPEKERHKWESLGILPGGAKAEVFDALVKTSTNLNSNPIDMLLHCLRLGIATGYYGLMLTNAVNDILLGDPEIRMVSCGLGTINTNTLNIAITGHQQAISSHGINQLLAHGLKEAAMDAGAAGVRVVGLTCVGQDMQSRTKADDTLFSGHAGDNFTAEAVLLTGGIDLLVSDFNCSIAGLDLIAKDQGIPEVWVDDVAMLPNAVPLPLDRDDPATMRKIIQEAIAHFNNRKGKALPLPSSVSKTFTGITENSLIEFLGGTLEPLLVLIKEGKIRGLAGVLGCSNLLGGHGFLTEQLTRELIRRDILVLSAGCTSGILGNCGLMGLDATELAGPKLKEICRQINIPPVLNFGPCLGIGRVERVAQLAAQTLGIEIAQLPVVISAPEWLEEQALADGAFGLAIGLSLHLGSAPAVTGSDLVVEVLTNKMKDLTGGTLYIEPDAVNAAEWMANTIEEKRRGLGLD